MDNGFKKGFFTDISEEIAGNAFRTKKFISNKKKWIQNHTAKNINCEGKGCGDLRALRKRAAMFKAKTIKIGWVPFSFIFEKIDHGYRFRKEFFDRVPRVSFFNLISIPKNDIPSVGTRIAVRHQGILLKRNGGLFVRHAYIGSKKVEEISAVDFLLKAYLSKKNQKSLSGIGLGLFKISIRKN